MVVARTKRLASLRDRLTQKTLRRLFTRDGGASLPGERSEAETLPSSRVALSSPKDEGTDADSPDPGGTPAIGHKIEALSVSFVTTGTISRPELPAREVLLVDSVHEL